MAKSNNLLRAGHLLAGPRVRSGQRSRNTHVGMLGHPAQGQWGLETKGHKKCEHPAHPLPAEQEEKSGLEGTRMGQDSAQSFLGCACWGPMWCCPPGSWNQLSFNHTPMGLASNDCPHWLPLWPCPESERLLHAHLG